MGIIFAIGGGEIRDLETFAIDEKVVESTGKKSPKALFIPTASNESQGYIDAFNYVYGEMLECNTDVLLLLESKTSTEEARKKIMDSDIIYVGGGNTRKMLQVWEKYGVDNSLKEANENGKILVGLSAGSICWFKSGHSDSNSFDAEDGWNYIRIEGLNLIDAMHCPHYNEDTREEDFNKKILEYDEIGIAIDNNCAIEFKNNYYKIHKSDIQSKAYKVYQVDGKIIREELINTSEYKLIKDVLHLINIEIIPQRIETHEFILDGTTFYNGKDEKIPEHNVKTFRAFSKKIDSYVFLTFNEYSKKYNMVQNYYISEEKQDVLELTNLLQDIMEANQIPIKTLNYSKFNQETTDLNDTYKLSSDYDVSNYSPGPLWIIITVDSSANDIRSIKDMIQETINTTKKYISLELKTSDNRAITFFKNGQPLIDGNETGGLQTDF